MFQNEQKEVAFISDRYTWDTRTYIMGGLYHLLRL